MLRLLSLVVGAVMAALPAWSAEVTTFTLDNGMEVVVLEDHRAPVVVHMVWYKVGAADEPLGKSGIAHFLEHLMFKGTDGMAAGELSATVTENGGSDNAFTSWDYTAYFQRIASDRLGLVMGMEADRMRDLQMTEEDVATERDVVLEERSQRTDNDPASLFTEQRMAAQYLNHPYAVPIIGWRHEIEQLNRDDAFAFYHQYYAPNNAILIVAGDVQPDEVRALAEQHYGVIPPMEGIAPRVRPVEPMQLSERRMSYDDPRIAQPYMVRSYLAPERNPGDQAEAAALTFLAELLGGGQTSVLAKALQFDQRIALYAGAGYDGNSVDNTTFGLVAVPVPGTSLEDIEAAMDQVIADFMETGVDPDQFARLKMQLRASQIYADDNIQGLARKYGESLANGLTIADIEEWPEVLDAVTPDDVMAAAERLFDKRRAVTGYLMPTPPDAPATDVTEAAQ